MIINNDVISSSINVLTLANFRVHYARELSSFKSILLCRHQSKLGLTLRYATLRKKRFVLQELIHEQSP